MIKKFKVILLVLAIAILTTPLIVRALTLGGGIGIMPGSSDPGDPRTASWFVYTMNPGETKEDSVNLVNNSDDEVVVKVYPVDATTTNDGNFTLVDENVEQIGIGSWIDMFAYEVGLKPHEVKKIPFTITLPDNVDVGDHMGGIIVQEVSRGPAGTNKEGMTMSIVTRVGVRIYLTVPGERVEDISIEEFNKLFVKEESGFFRKFLDLNYYTQFILNLKNNGNVRIEPEVKVKIKNIFGQTVDELGGQLGMVFPKKSSNIFLRWNKNLFFGRYTAEAEVVYSDTVEPATTKIVFWAIPYKILTLLGALIIIIVLLRLVILYFMELSKESMVIYVMPKKELIQDVAEKFKVNWAKLARINHIKKPYSINKGQKLFIPENRRNRELLAALLKKGVLDPSIKNKLDKSKKNIFEKIHGGKKSIKIIMIAVVIIVVGGGLTALFFYKSKKQNIQQVPVEISNGGDDTDETRTKSGLIKRSEISLAVYNFASDQDNVDKLLKKLEFIGFQVSTTNIRESSNYDKTTFEYKNEELEQAEAIRTALELKREDVDMVEVDDLDYDVVIAYFEGEVFDLELPELTEHDLRLIEDNSNQGDSSALPDMDQVEVSVLNGGAPAGTAGQVAQDLINAGFAKATAANADSFDYQGVTINYQPELQSYAGEIKSLLADSYQVINLETNPSLNNEIEVILGS